MDFGSSPTSVLLRQTPNQNANFLTDPRPAATRPGFPATIQPETSSMPADDRFGLDDYQRILPEFAIMADPVDPSARRRRLRATVVRRVDLDRGEVVGEIDEGSNPRGAGVGYTTVYRLLSIVVNNRYPSGGTSRGYRYIDLGLRLGRA
jgi:hypothetical protein